MAQSKKSFRHESLQNANTIEGILESIVDGVRKRKVTFSDEDDEIVMEPKGMLRLRVKANQDDNRYSFSLRISWQVPDDSKMARKNLSVSSK